MYCMCLLAPAGDYTGALDEPGAMLSIAFIEAMAKKCFPKMTFQGDHNVTTSVDNKGRPQSCDWDLWQARLFNDEGLLVAEGEALATRSHALDSLENILSKLPKPYRFALPVTFSTISCYEGMRCSACTDLRECMSSGPAWLEQLAKK